MTSSRTDPGRTAGRWLLGAFLAGAGTLHLTAAREEFQAQVPDWVPVDADLVVVGSGMVEVALGVALLTQRRHRHAVGWTTAAFFVAIFPGNVAQYMEGTDAFGLDTHRARLVRLFFQPVLVAWALWSTGAWRAWRRGAASSWSPVWLRHEQHERTAQREHLDGAVGRPRGHGHGDPRP